MGRIIKAMILAWLGKKLYDRVADSDEPEQASRGKGSTTKRAPTRKRAA